MPETRWTPSPPRPRLLAATVDVWRADLAAAAAGAAGGEERERVLLSADEVERAARFARPEDGRRWAAARAILRELLGACLDTDPAELCFAQGPHGKPRLDGAAGAASAGLRFNVSHSGDVALYAVALEREVGVDVELPRRSVDHVAIARRILGDTEAERLVALDPPAREREFLRAWVRWEALLKCRGTGIGGAERAPSGPDPWIRELDVGAPAAAALAVERGPCALRCWRWPPAVA